MQKQISHLDIKQKLIKLSYVLAMAWAHRMLSGKTGIGSQEVHWGGHWKVEEEARPTTRNVEENDWDKNKSNSEDMERTREDSHKDGAVEISDRSFLCHIRTKRIMSHSRDIRTLHLYGSSWKLLVLEQSR